MKRVSIFIFLSLIFLFSCPSFPQTNIINQELEIHQKKMEQLESSLKAKVRKKRKVERLEEDVLAELEKLDKKIALQWESLDKAKREWTEAELSLEETKKELSQIKKEVSSLKHFIEMRLNAYRQLGEIGFLNILFESESLPGLLARRQYLKLILDEDSKKRKEYVRALRVLSKKEKELRERQIFLKAMTKRLEKEAHLLEERKQEKRKYLESLKGQKRRYQRMIAQLMKAKRRLKRVIDELTLKAQAEVAAVKQQSKEDQFSFSAQKGRLNLPVQGKVILFKNKNAFRGLVVESPWGSQIRAIFDGKVVYNDSLPGYGKVFIVDHGSGYMSLIAQGQNFTKNVGEDIAEGEVIGLSGGGPWVNEGVYIEIRKDGRQLKTISWFDLRGIEIVYR